jgi:hypothetical protein
LDEATTLAKGMDANGIKRTVDLCNQAEYWPTPNTKDAEAAARHTTETGVMHPGTTLTDAIRQWPTPAGRDHRDPNAKSYQERDGSTKGEQLPNFVEHQWPTPKAQSHEGRRGNDLRHGRILDEDANQWRTPNTRDHHPQGPRQDAQRQLYVADQAASWWPTPDTSNRKSAKAMTASTENGRRSGGGNSSPPGLEQMAEIACGETPAELQGILLPPATQRALTQVSGSCLPPAPVTHGGLPFSTRVRILLLLCRQLRRRLPSPYRRSPRSIFRKKLNANFGDWLMGWLPGWSNADRVFSASEMESYLFNARSRLRSLLGD